jgi:hypothetical protein
VWRGGVYEHMYVSWYLCSCFRSYVLYQASAPNFSRTMTFAATFICPYIMSFLTPFLRVCILSSSRLQHAPLPSVSLLLECSQKVNIYEDEAAIKAIICIFVTKYLFADCRQSANEVMHKCTRLMTHIYHISCCKIL